MNTKIGDFWTNTGLGTIAVFIYALFAFSQEQLLRMLPGIVGTIVCTAGLALLIIIPALYIIGTILYALWLLASYLFAGIRSKTEQESSPAVAVTGKIVAVANYIISAREAGLANIEITSNLEANGWDHDSIEKGFDYVLFRQQLRPAASGGLS